MQTDRIWIVLVILALVLIGSNLLMFAAARGMRGFKGDMFKNYRDAAHPWKKEDASLRELSQRVRDLKSPPTDKDQP